MVVLRIKGHEKVRIIRLDFLDHIVQNGLWNHCKNWIEIVHCKYRSIFIPISIDSLLEISFNNQRSSFIQCSYSHVSRRTWCVCIQYQSIISGFIIIIKSNEMNIDLAFPFTPLVHFLFLFSQIPNRENKTILG